MKDLQNAIQIRDRYNKIPFNKFAKMTEKFIGKEISESQKELWEFTGLNNVDFFKLVTNNQKQK